MKNALTYWQSINNFKITNRDKYLLIGFVCCCIGILFLSWSLV